MTTRIGILNVLNDTFRGYRRHFLVLLMLGVVSAALDGISINAIIPLVSFLLGDGATPTDFISRSLVALFGLVGVPFQFRYLLAFVAILFVGRAVLLTVFTYIRARINTSFFAREVGALFAATMQAEWPFLLRQKAGSVQNTIFWDAKRSAQLLDAVVQFVQSSTGALIYLAIAVNIDPMITGITLVGGIIIFVVLRPLIKRTRSLGEDASVNEKSLVHHIGEHLQGFKTVKASGAGGRVRAAAEPYVRRLRDAYARTVLVQALSSIYIQPLSFLFIIAIFAFSYRTPGFSLAAFAATLYLIQKIFVYFESTQTTIHTIVQLVPFAENIGNFKRELAQHRERDEEGDKPFEFERTIELSDVSLSYRTGTRVLKHVTCSIEKGSMLGIIGPSGGGKTSLADVILRLFRPDEGDVLLDGVPAQRVRLDQWRRRIAYVSQDAFLMNASIADNIRFYDDSLNMDDIEEAARQAHIYEDIKKLPHGFDSVVGDRGITLSGGQRQRVALARALARKPVVLVLDEVTSSLDSELERHIQKVIEELRGTITFIVIAHRVATVLGSDRLLVLADGEVKEEGTPEEMLADEGSYLSRMLALQRGETV